MKILRSFIVFLALTVCLVSASYAETEPIDASDPTKIYSYAGAGIKFTDYTNNETMTEIRATGTIALSSSDSLMFELGYGWHSGNMEPGSNSGLTNGRLRWFHLFPMDYSVISGYRGWGTQLDLQLAGNLKGTDGQNVVAFGGMPAFSINESWSLYLPISLVNSWDKRFEKYNGAGLGIAPQLVYTTERWWKDAYLQIQPNYIRFFSGALKGEGSGSLDLTTGGQITATLFWDMTLQKNFDKDLKTYRRDESSGLKNDWNIFLNVTSYF